jgi:hypothetical protein
MRTRLATCGLVALVVAAMSVAVACGGGDKSSPSNGTGDPSAPSGGPASQGPTGLPEVDHLIEAAQGGNVIELAALAGYEKVGCEGGGSASAPACREGESSGTKVEALAFSNCDKSWVRPEGVTAQYQLLLPSGDVSLYAVYQPSDTSDSFAGGFGSQYVVVLAAGKRSDGQPAGVALHVRQGRVTWLEKACGSIDELVSASRVKSMIVAPAE